MSRFSKSDTSVMKGVAIILMLIHHLFYSDDLISRCTLILPYEDKILLLFSSLGKVCVAIFVLISGYGLYKSYLSATETGGYKKTVLFILSHIWNLLKQYWIIVLPFALLGILTGWRTVYDAYGSNWIGKLITDIFGLNYLIYGTTNLFNVTCWYLGIAILFFVLTPFFCWLMKKNPILLVGLSMLLGYDHLLISRRIGLHYILAFVIGMLLSKYEILDRIKSMKKDQYYIFGSICLVLAIAAVRHKYGIIVDGVFALSIIIFMLGIIDILPKVEKVIGMIGNHSATIFMMHTFVFMYYFEKITYTMKYPVLVLLFLLTVCMVYATVLNHSVKSLKKWLIYKGR